MPMLTYIQQHGLNLTETWQVCILVGFAVVCIIALIVVIIKARKL